MGTVSADSDVLLQTLQNMQNAVNSIEATKNSISMKYQQLGLEWKDKKYKDLGDIMYDCTKSLNNILKTLLQGQKYVALLSKSLQEYEKTQLGGSSSGISGIGMPTINAGEIDAGAAVAAKFTGKTWTEQLSKAEHAALRDYTDTAYRNINAVLRGVEPSFEAGNYERATLIHNALSRCSIPQTCTVYRGASLRSLGDFADASDSALIGSIISDDGFMSTSLNREDAFGGDIRYEISVPAGARGAYVGYLSRTGHYESEVLLDCGQMMQITDVRRDRFGNRIIRASILI